MARASKSTATAERKTRRRLTPDQKANIAKALSHGETGNAIAERLGISAAAVYAQRRKGNVSAASDNGSNHLRVRLVNFAVRTLLRRDVADAERGELEREVQQELLRRVAAGI